MASLRAETAGRHRYGIILGLAVATVVFVIVAPDRAGSRAIALLLTGVMLTTVVATSRGDRTLRETTAGALTMATVALAIAVAVHAVPVWVGSLGAGIYVIATLVQLVRGVVRLLRERGVAIQAVTGALAVYLLLGLMFSIAITVAAKLGHGFYFAQHTDGTASQHVYFSFTTLTTTGFGDLSPAGRGGRALTVVEMLTGQIYLVTVISLLVGNLRRRGERP
jgi:ion channel